MPALDEPSIGVFDTITDPGPPSEHDTVITELWERFWPMALEATFPFPETGKPAFAAASGPVTAAGAPDMSSAMKDVGGALAEVGKRMEAVAAAAAAERGGEAGGGEAEPPIPSSASHSTI